MRPKVWCSFRGTTKRKSIQYVIALFTLFNLLGEKTSNYGYLTFEDSSKHEKLDMKNIFILFYLVSDHDYIVLFVVIDKNIFR